ncbi:putative CLAVATA3/ESR (CLE)-related protein 27-like isoform X1 [Capsicum annuum]|nr:putative CLAVATA3/ESR (CLE)-related protein 27-like isoform X1 [Capsicum annuum]KAF3656053.1 putative CLAVATA3/ESR (CLE)-related protein 27-like isoform X1 [Capsicum annuum]
MKRQRGSKVMGNNYEEKKRAKRVMEKQSEEVKITQEEQRKNDVKEVELMSESNDNNWIINEWLCSWSNVNVLDEQMSWGTCWSPNWDMEFLGEAYINLYNDVLWDDDIWDLKSIKEVPSP